MNTKLSIAGAYLKDGASFFSEQLNVRLVKGHRQPKNGKTTEFLILKPCCGNDLLPDGSKEKYVSGIFWNTANTFKIDFYGIKYVCTVTSEGLTVEPLQERTKCL